MRKAYILTLMALALSLQAHAQHVRQGSLAPTTNDISLETACNKLSNLLEKLGRTDPGKSKFWVWLTNRIILGRETRLWDMWCQRNLSVGFDARTGILLSYHDLKKQADQHYGRNRTKAKFFATQQEAKSKFNAVAAKLEIPASWKAYDFKIKGDEQTDRASHGYVSGKFKDASGKFCASLALDIQDGKPISFTRVAP